MPLTSKDVTMTDVPSERLNGALEKITTNNHPESQEFTRIKKWNTTQNMCTILPTLCEHLPQKASDQILKFALPKSSRGGVTESLGTREDTSSQYTYNPQKNEGIDYESRVRLLNRMNEMSKQIFVIATDIHKMKKKKSSIIPLSRWVNQLDSVDLDNVKYNIKCKGVSNSTVIYQAKESKKKTKLACGQIEEIFTILVEVEGKDQFQLWFEITRFDDLTPTHQKVHGLTNWPHAKMTLVYKRQNKKDLIRAEELISHVSLWETPDNCFGIKESTLLVTELFKKICTGN
ncbi:uncharacterized protein MELLADRAFT_104023 [Melampsora larici-populina 98AG31]|uniref:Uncharacterized protein n=1 Tax=Melampsora larici-populina (strain 98AG31 / pathotype 3-4-7) TaxID=747676 RepID=F4RDB1_MELLP|nr:uncharacterized protein MELLADRAFT_104023 [Melampsora larici-populina 98AG31]EGG09639.1 hypothetical protein MELLADRAFT_104023 [Melampsora larici-populina 98AG31]